MAALRLSGALRQMPNPSCSRERSPVRIFTDDLRDNEAAKIACGEAHFKALAAGSNPARYIKATKIDDLMDQC